MNQSTSSADLYKEEFDQTDEELPNIVEEMVKDSAAKSFKLQGTLPKSRINRNFKVKKNPINSSPTRFGPRNLSSSFLLGPKKQILSTPSKTHSRYEQDQSNEAKLSDKFVIESATLLTPKQSSLSKDLLFKKIESTVQSVLNSKDPEISDSIQMDTYCKEEPKFRLKAKEKETHSLRSLPTGKEHEETVNKSEYMEANSLWWPTSKWAKLKKIIDSSQIKRSEAINSSLLMKELGCKDKFELSTRYDFLRRFYEKNQK